MINDYETFLTEHVLGNVYSIRSEHTKAVAYFRRAIKLDPGYLAAWTLMGHEFVELSNTHAAIEAYRKACSKYELFSPHCLANHSKQPPTARTTGRGTA